MGNINLPTPVALAGASLCLLGGYLVGVVAGPSEPSETTAQVESFDSASDELCLSGDAVADVDATEDGVLCGTWRHDADAADPREGDEFRFVSVSGGADAGGPEGQDPATVIYGDVVR